MDKRTNIAVAFSGINEEYQGKMCVGISRKLKSLKNVTVAYFSAFNANLGIQEVEDAENEIFSLINFDIFDALVVIPNNFLYCKDVLSALVKRANDSNTPVFAMDIACDGCKNILINNVPAYKKLVDHLIDVHGLKDLMYVGGVKDKPYCAEKLTQFKKSLADHGMEFDIERCLWGEFYDGAAKRELAKYLDNGGKLPEAFVCANDSMALGICYELEERGYTVPEDVYVTGFDGIITNLLHQPAITTVEVPYQELGGKTLEAVLDYLQNPSEDNDVEKKYSIVSDPSFFGSCECVADERMIRNQISKNLSVDLYRRNYMNSYFVKMSTDLSTCNDMETYFKTLEHYVNEIQVKSIYLCYSLEYTLSYERYDSFLENYSIPSKAQLSDDICAKIIYKHGKICEPEVFKKQEILPDMFVSGDDCREYYFVPIHFLSRTFGYVACEVRGDLESGNSAMYNSWVSYIAISHNNVLEQIKSKRYTDVLEDLYNKDSLTMLLNRRGLLTQQAEKIDCITENNLSVMLFLLDLDNMKGINDGFGHAAGDEALLLIAESLNEVKGEEDIVCRYGGDEFLLFGIGYDEAAAEEFGRRLEKEISRRGEENQVKYDLSASFGYSISKNYTAEHLDELCSEADTNMYIHKRSKKANA
ncbi:MAG: GGDEF domain-containing protein [Ruminococcus sp.]|nr:GGDEF domain-containing protein [Ruminococcus sp.]